MTRQTFITKFKLQLVNLCEYDKPNANISQEYDITPSALDRQIKNYKEMSSFTAKDNKTEQENPLAVIVSDLAYVRVKIKWHYVYLFVDVFNREIIGYSTV